MGTLHKYSETFIIFHNHYPCYYTSFISNLQPKKQELDQPTLFSVSFFSFFVLTLPLNSSAIFIYHMLCIGIFLAISFSLSQVLAKSCLCLHHHYYYHVFSITEKIPWKRFPESKLVKLALSFENLPQYSCSPQQCRFLYHFIADLDSSFLNFLL